MGMLLSVLLPEDRGEPAAWPCCTLHARHPWGEVGDSARDGVPPWLVLRWHNRTVTRGDTQPHMCRSLTWGHVSLWGVLQGMARQS